MEDQSVLILEFHESPWFEYQGMWPTFEKLKERYWWLGMYKDVVVEESARRRKLINHV